MADIFSAGIGAVGDLFGGIAGGLSDFEAAKGYEKAGRYSTQSADLTAASTRIQLAQKDREIFSVLGGQRSDIASSGALASGSALDIIRSSAQQASLSKQLIEHQGLITELGFSAQAEAYKAQAGAAKTAGVGSIVGGVLGAAASLIGL